MKTFGGFRSGDEFFYGELRGDEVHRLSQPYWIQVQPTGEILPLASLQIDVPVAPSKLIAVGLNYADHIAEMKRTEIGAPLIWFKAPSSLLAHQGVIEIAFPNHQTDFETELAVVIGARHEKCQRRRFTRSRFRLHHRSRYHRSRFAKTGEAIWSLQIVRLLYTDRTLRICRCRCARRFDKVVAERRAAPERAHEPNDPSSCADYFIRQSIAHTFAGRCDSNGNTRWRGPDSSGRRIGSRNR